MPAETQLKRTPIWKRHFSHGTSFKPASILRRHWFHFVSQITVLAFCAYWYFRPPAPNKAVLALTFVTVVMALYAMRPVHKAVYLGLVLTLILIENHALNKDHEEATATANQTLTTMKQIGNLARENLESLTGGDSVAYISPQPPTADERVPLAVVNAGKYPLTGVTVVFTNFSSYHFGAESSLFVGTLTPHAVRPLNVSLLPVPSKTAPIGIASFMVEIYAQNGMTNELLQFRKGKKMLWDYRINVTREVPSPNSMIPLQVPATSDIPGLNFSYMGWIEDRNSPQHP